MFSAHRFAQSLFVCREPRKSLRCKMRYWEMLNRRHVHVKHKDAVQSKLNQFIDAGPTRLQVLSDFDQTLTKQRTERGGRPPNCFDMLNKCKSMPESFAAACKSLGDRYRPIEKDPHMSVFEKTPMMYEWWSEVSRLLVGVPFDANEIDEAVGQFEGLFRDRCEELFAKLATMGIPVLVFSAGLGEFIVSMMQHENILQSNVKVISNNLQYGPDGRLNGMKEPLITTCNKNLTALDNSDYSKLMHNRDHIIVLGDSIGDAAMTDGGVLASSSQIFKIGFLYDYVEENLEKYMHAFDIVLVDDQTMDVPCALLTLIAAARQI